VFEGEDKTKVDIIITIGGDGNLLWISKLFQKIKVPIIISFACGTRNFLCYNLVENYEKVLSEFFEILLQG
jgi:NAD kinase